MNKLNINNMRVDLKKRILKTYYKGLINKADLNNSEIVDIINSDNTVSLVSIECWGQKEFKHKGRIISKEEFCRLELLYKGLFPDRPSAIHIVEKERINEHPQ